MLTEAQRAAVLEAGAGLHPAGLGDKVYRDECSVSFALPQDEGGLFTNLATFRSYSPAYLAADVEGNGGKLYLHQHWVKVPKEAPTHLEDATVVASGGAAKVDEAGAETYSFEDNWVWRKDYSVYLAATKEHLPWPAENMPEFLATVITSVLTHDDAFRAAEIASAKVQFVAVDTKYADALVHVEGGAKVSGDPSKWKCATCGLGQNLWLNLSDGHIGCGRKQEGGEEGYSHALAHYNETGGLYPLAVKLGTITPDGRADVYSYAPDENDMVVNPCLAAHLLRWGIDMTAQSKTAKSMGELNMDRNQQAEAASIAEGGKKHVALVGPGYTGLRNLGNSCYMNSLLQVLITMPEFQHALLPGGVAGGPVGTAEARLEQGVPTAFAPAIASGTAAEDLITQLRKLAVGMLTGYAVTPAAAEAAAAHAAAAAAAGADSGEVEEPVEVARRALGDAAEEGAIGPRALRAVVGAGHPEFGSNRQQDVSEYLGHFLEVLGKAEGKAGPWPTPAAAEGGAAAPALPPALSRMFAFNTQTRTVDGATGKVGYMDQEAGWLELPIPLAAATNTAEVEAYQAKKAAQDAVRAAREAAGKVGDEERESKVPRVEGGDADAATAGAAALGVDPDIPLDVVVPAVPFEACVGAWSSPETIEGFTSPDTGAPGTATRTVRVATFPRYLAVTLRRYMVDDTWQPVKIDADVPLPQDLDLSALRGPGLQEGEEEMGGGAAEGAAAAPVPDAGIVGAVVGMGFSENAGKRAALAVSNSAADEAIAWLMGHMDDADLNDPLPEAGAEAGPTFPAESLMMLGSMGFPEPAVKKALWECKMDMERASNWLFDHMGQFDTMDLSIDTSPAVEAPLEDGEGQYELMAFVSHIGRTTAGGHYVAHVKRAGKWVFANDRSVTASQATPFGRGFMYFYRRKDAPALPNMIGAPIAHA